jgi:AbrB family looped-hinge helix DNA binding protein
MNEKYCNMKLCWIVTIWPKWQIVIPKDLREKLLLSTWDTLAVMLKDDKYIWLVKNEDMWELMKYIESENNNI